MKQFHDRVWQRIPRAIRAPLIDQRPLTLCFTVAKLSQPVFLHPFSAFENLGSQLFTPYIAVQHLRQNVELPRLAGSERFQLNLLLSFAETPLSPYIFTIPSPKRQPSDQGCHRSPSLIQRKVLGVTVTANVRLQCIEKLLTNVISSHNCHDIKNVPFAMVGIAGLIACALACYNGDIEDFVVAARKRSRRLLEKK